MKRISLLIFAVMVLLSFGLYSEEPAVIKPVVSTTATSGRNADDPAIWVDKEHPERSVIFGTDKDSGVEVWDLHGNLLQRLPEGMGVNNIDERDGFILGGKEVSIVVANIRKEGKLAVFVVNPNYTKGDVLRQIAGVNSRGNNIQKDSYGIALYRRPSDGAMYVFDIPKKRGRKLRQYIIKDDGTGEGVIVTPIRDLNYTGGVAEGMVADDELGYLYMSEEDKCVHKFYADPDKGDDEVARFAFGDGIKADREGLALYKCKDGTGYLILSSQGNDTYKIYERQGNNKFLRTVLPLNQDGESGLETDGLDVCSVPIPGLFPAGFLVVHGSPTTRFHLYDWRDVIGNNLPLCKE